MAIERGENLNQERVLETFNNVNDQTSNQINRIATDKTLANDEKNTLLDKLNTFVDHLRHEIVGD